MTNPTFKPMVVGQPDNTERTKQINTLYNDICFEAEGLKAYLQMLFTEDQDLSSIDFISDLLNSEPEFFIRQTWIVHKKISLPGIDIKKLINSDLLDIPKYAEIIEGTNNLKELLAKAKSLKFNFPLQKLVDPEGYFTLTDEFRQQLHESEVVYTENEQQNRVLEAVTELKNAINKLCTLRILPVSNLSNISIRYDRFVLKRTNNPDEPFTLNPTMFKTTLRNLPKV